MKYKNKCHNRLFELRTSKGFTSRREFVKFLNKELGFKISIAAISNLENHKHENPTFRIVDCLARYFDVSYDYLMGKTNYNIRYGNDGKGTEIEQFPEGRLFVERRFS